MRGISHSIATVANSWCIGKVRIRNRFTIYISPKARFHIPVQLILPLERTNISGIWCLLSYFNSAGSNSRPGQISSSPREEETDFVFCNTFVNPELSEELEEIRCPENRFVYLQQLVSGEESILEEKSLYYQFRLEIGVDENEFSFEMVLNC